MTKKQEIQLFETKKVRTVWDSEQEKWFFCVVDVVEALTESANPSDYIKKMKESGCYNISATAVGDR